MVSSRISFSFFQMSKKRFFDSYSKWKRLTPFQKCCVRHDILKNYKVPKKKLQGAASQSKNDVPKIPFTTVQVKKKKYVCVHCAETFFQISALQMHMKKCHEEKKSYRYSKCTAEFTWKNNLKRHYEKSHLKEKEVVENPRTILEEKEQEIKI